jgi:hypothetical protein
METVLWQVLPNNLLDSLDSYKQKIKFSKRNPGKLRKTNVDQKFSFRLSTNTKHEGVNEEHKWSSLSNFLQ